MSLELIFSLTSSVAMAAWIALVLQVLRPDFGRWLQPVGRGVIPMLLAVAYVYLALAGLGQNSGGYGSLAEVKVLFSSDSALLAGWIHFLVFDLLIGYWIAQDARANQLSPWLQVPILLLTFGFGPAGWLVYQGVKWVYLSVDKRAAI